MARGPTTTGGRDATSAVLPGDVCISVGNPQRPCPDGWRWVALSDLARLESGHTPSRKRADWWGGEIPWIGIRDATGNHGRVIFDTNETTNEEGIANSSARVLPVNTVCLSRTASVGYVVVMGRPMATSQDFVNWVCDENLNPHFLKYALLCENRALKMFATGSVHQTIYFPEAKAFHICAPSRIEQDKIANVLLALDDKIELNRRMNETLEAMARAIFRDWFVDFGPTRTKMEGRAPYLTADLWSLFPSTLDNATGLPTGWSNATLQQLTSKIGSGATPLGGSKVYVEAGIALIRSQNVYDSAFEWAGLARITDEAADRLNGVTVMENDVLINITGDSILRTCAVDRSVLPARVNQHVAIVRPAVGMPPHYIHQYLLLERTKSLLLGMDAGGSRSAVTKGHLESLSILLPAPEALEAFAKLTDPLFDRVEVNTREARTLAETRDFLLPKLMSGEVSVRDAVAAIEQVA